MEQILKTFGSTYLNLKEFGFVYGVQGALLRRNLEKLWFSECVTKSKYNVFLIPPNSLTSGLKDLKSVGIANAPFGIVEIEDVKNTWNEFYFSKSRKPVLHKIGKITTVYEGDNAILSIKDLFYKKQRERKSWWQRISENPSIFNVSEVKQVKGKEYSEIQAQLPFGNIVVETIKFKKNVPINFIQDNANLRIVEQVTSLDWGCLALLCDGYVEIEDSKELQINPKLMPYKAYSKAIISPNDDETVQRDLNDLTLYIIELLRKEGVDSLIMNDVKKPEVFWVPYIITVDNESLKSGLVNLVCQRTLCGEIVHITNMAKRIKDLCM